MFSSVQQMYSQFSFSQFASSGVLIHRSVIIAEKACLVTGDLLVVVVTWYKTYITIQDVRKTKVKAPLAMLLFRDGKHRWLS